jgi:DNA-binding winged helix-turn-helix (wHTH) protein
VLDIDRRELSCGGQRVALEPQVFDVLLYLVQNSDRVVSKDELFDKVWDGRIVSESTLTSRINAVRRAVNDSVSHSRLRTRPIIRGLRCRCSTAPQSPCCRSST